MLLAGFHTLSDGKWPVLQIEDEEIKKLLQSSLKTKKKPKKKGKGGAAKTAGSDDEQNADTQVPDAIED